MTERTWPEVLNRRLNDGTAWTEGFTAEEIALPMAVQHGCSIYFEQWCPECRGNREWNQVSTYEAQLPNVFPYVVEGSAEDITKLVNLIMLNQASSFAVTVDGSSGTWRLWLSRVSKEYLSVAKGVMVLRPANEL